MRIIKSLLLAAALLTAPGIVRAGTVTLPDSDTSSLGAEVAPKDTPFLIRCTDAVSFNKRMKAMKARGLIVGTERIDNSLVMVFKAEDGSMAFVRSDRAGKTLCIFGIVNDGTVDIGTALWDGAAPEKKNGNKNGD